ncbi:MAG TPA: hypothetical protein VOB72_23960 [Candidatus Dormibacteraeota bacterium]|nr:hypothetical protein [Candidatus Dormibacteraeota bacterium]
MTSGDWPDRSEFPYRALIRIRYVHEVDLEILRVVQHAVARTLARDVAAGIVRVTTAAAARVARAGAARPIPVEQATDRLASLRAVLSDEDLCPVWTTTPWPWPGPWPTPWQDLSSVDGVRVLVAAETAAMALADREAADQLRTAVAGALEAMAAPRALEPSLAG